jgi:hypothetical protein
MINKIAAITVALPIVMASTARSADIVYASADRSAIAISGIMAIEDVDKFLNISAGVPRAVIIFDSPGGATLAGIKIGEIIRIKRYSTFVKHDTMCASACGLAWLGGTNRAISVRAAVGFHAAYDATTMQESGWGNALVGAYLNKLGLSDSAIYYITHEGPTSIQWLTAEDATKLGIEAIAVSCDPSRCALTPTTTNITQYTDSVNSMEQQIAGAIVGYFTAWSSSGNVSYADRALQLDFITKLNNLFSDPVAYYGKLASRDSVIADKEGFYEQVASAQLSRSAEHPHSQMRQRLECEGPGKRFLQRVGNSGLQRCIREQDSKRCGHFQHRHRRTESRGRRPSGRRNR